MHRRQFIHAAAAGALALGLPAASWPPALPPNPHVLARPELLGMLGEVHVRAIGLHYRKSLPDAGDVEAMRTAIMMNAEYGPALPEQLRQQIRGDFGAGRTLLIDGWVLSVTEARQCALFSLLSP